MEVKNYFAQDTQGNVLGSAQVYLYLAGTMTLATGLQNINGAALANPFVSQPSGLVQFKADDGNYDLRVVKPGREFTIRIQCFDGVLFSAKVDIDGFPVSSTVNDDYLIPAKSTGGMVKFQAITLWGYLKAKVTDILGAVSADFSYYPDIDLTGASDSTAAIQAVMGLGITRFTGKGTIKFSSKISIPVGVIIDGNDQLKLLYAGSAGGDAIEFTEASSGAKQLSGLTRLRLLSNTRGRYGVTTPKSSNAWNRQYRFDFTGFQSYDANETLTIATNYWDRVLNIGDCRQMTMRRFQVVGGWPSTDTNGVDHKNIGVYISSVVGAIGIVIDDGSFTSCSHPMELSDGVEGHYIGSGVECVSCWDGLTYSNAQPEPGGFVDAAHFNASHAAIIGKNRVELTIGDYSAYRSAAMATHAEGWSALSLEDCNFKITVGNVHVVPGSATALTDSWAFRFKNCAFTFCHIKGYDISLSMTGAVLLDNVSGLRMDAGTARGCATFCRVVSTATDVKMLNIDASNSDPSMLVVPAGYNPTGIVLERAPLGANNSPASIVINASADFTVQPRAGITTVSLSGSSLTANLVLSRVGASAGNTVEIKYVNASAAGSTVTILNGAGGTTLNIIRSGNTNRYFIRYKFNGSNWACDELVQDLDATMRT